MENIENSEQNLDQEAVVTEQEELVIKEPQMPEPSEREQSHHEHSHHSHHHSSHKHHHSSHSKKKRSKKSNPLQKKIEEYAIKALVLLLVFVMTIVIGWCISANSEIDNLFKKNEALTTKLTELEQKLGNYSAPGNNSDADEVQIPEYVQEEAQSVIAEVQGLQNGNTVSFIAIADMHLNLENQESVTALEHAGQAMELIREGLDIDFAVNLGDYTYGSPTTTVDTGIEEIKKANALIQKGFDGIPNFRTPGNHDLLLYSYAQNKDHLDASELYSLIGSYNKNTVTQEQEKDRGYCYRDFEEQKLRVICLNTSDIKGMSAFSEEYLSGERYNTVSKEQLQWLSESLKLTGKGEGWQILLLSHIPLYADSNANVEAILDAYSAGTSGSVTVDGTTVRYDFQGQNSGKLIANVHGHLHNHRTDSVGTARIPAVTIPNASVDRNRSNDYPDGFGEKVVYEKVAGTADETAFCVVTIDLHTGSIYVTAYGAGYSRQIAY